MAILKRRTLCVSCRIICIAVVLTLLSGNIDHALGIRTVSANAISQDFAGEADEEETAAEALNVLFSDSFETSFKNLPSGWVHAGESSVTAVKKDVINASDGKHSVKISKMDTENEAGIWSPSFPAESGKVYTFSADAYVYSGVCRIHLDFLDEDGDIIYNMQKDSPAQLGEWKEVSLTAYAPATAKSLRIGFSAAKPIIGEVSFDNAVVKTSADLPDACFTSETEHSYSVYSDVPDRDGAIISLLGLGILRGYADGTFKPDKFISKAEFSGNVVRAMGMDDAILLLSAASPVEDIESKAEYAKHINTLYQLGLINDAYDAEIGPDDLITAEQALKMLIRGLGYEYLAQKKGGFPNDYLYVAASIGMLKGVAAKIGEPLSRGDAAKLIYNAMDIDMAEVSSVDANGAKSYRIIEGRTILANWFKAAKINGVIESTKISDPEDSLKLKDDEVSIDGKVFRTGKTPAKSMLGYYVTGYYVTDQKENEDTLVFIRKHPTQNRELTIDADDILGDIGREGLKYLVSGENAIQTVRYDEEKLKVYYNGRAVTRFPITTYPDRLIPLPFQGYITLVDNNRDGVFEVLFVYEYVNILVGGISLSENIITDLGDNKLNLELNPGDKGHNVLILKDDQPISLGEIKPNSVVSVMADKMVSDTKNGHARKVFDKDNATLYTLVVSEQSVSGSVDEESEGCPIIGGQQYDYSKDYLTRHEEGYPGLGAMGTFYLDIKGKIAAFKLNFKANKQIGYLYQAYSPAESTSLRKKIEFKILGQDGKVTIYSLAEKISVNGDKRKTADLTLLASDEVKLYEADGTLIRQLIMFDLNYEGEITNVFTAFKEGEAGYDTALLKLDRDVPSSDYFCYKPAKRLGNHSGGPSSDPRNQDFCFDSSTIVFEIPKDLPPEYGDIVAEYFRAGNEMLLNDGTYYSAEAYNISDVGVASIIVYFPKNSILITSTQRQRLLLVTRVTEAVNEKDEFVKRLHGLYEGKEIELTLSPYVSVYEGTTTGSNSPGTISTVSIVDGVKKIKPGDLLYYYSYSLTGVTDLLVYAFHADAPAQKMPNGRRVYTTPQIWYGTISKRDGDYLLFSFDTEAGNGELVKQPQRPVYLDGPLVYRFNNKTQRAEVIYISDIIPSENNKVVLHINYETTRLVVIYED